MKFPNSISFLFDPKTIRERSQLIFERCKNGQTHFAYHEEKLESVVDYVFETITQNYPDFNIPFHSRWGHFKVGGIDRVELLDKHLEGQSKKEIAKTKIDLVITSVLLDAGAGMDWTYQSKDQTYKRSEGLAVASFDWFMQREFSNNHSFAAHGSKLQELKEQELVNAFQVSPENPLVGVSGRLELLKSLGKVVSKDEFVSNRPGDIFDILESQVGKTISAKDILNVVLFYFGDIWPSRESRDGYSLGDCWSYPLLNDDKNSLDNFVPFHKLSQWLSYSLIEPLEEGGFVVNDIDSLTGLPEYRNGGLFVDRGLISLRDSALIELEHAPSSELIVEWRALTISLLDIMGEKIRAKLNKTSEELPLCRVLEGGTWHAGRRAAKELRSDMASPIKIKSDGTVF